MAKFTQTAIKKIAQLEAHPLPAIIPVEHPVILMHGLGMIAGVRRGGHLCMAAEHLRSLGVRAYAPNVAPYNTIEVRSMLWKDRIEHVLRETRVEKVNLIAHSMGGLDARYLISRMGLSSHVASLITISTPHHGTSLAGYVLSQPERIRSWLTEFANWIGTYAVEDGSADFRQALSQLTPEYITNVFNASVPNHDTVKYWSVSGKAGKGTSLAINPFLRIFNAVIHEQEGVNDGMVSVSSSVWGEHLQTVEADHAQQIGVPFIGSSSFDYRQLMSDLAKILVKHNF